MAQTNVTVDPNAAMTVQMAADMFVALGGAAGVRTLLNAATLLAGRARDESLDPTHRATLKAIAATADLNVAAELCAPSRVAHPGTSQTPNAA